MLKRWFAAALCLLALLCCAAMAEEAVPAQVGGIAPDFELTLLDGETLRLSDLRGKVVYLNIWATWCPPCVAEIPDIQRLSEAHPDDLVVIGASVDQDPQAVVDFVAERGLTYSIGIDGDFSLISDLYPTQYIPESVFISPDGVVTSMEVAMMSAEQMEARYQDALNYGR